MRMRASVPRGVRALWGAVRSRGGGFVSAGTVVQARLGVVRGRNRGGRLRWVAGAMDHISDRR